MTLKSHVAGDKSRRYQKDPEDLALMRQFAPADTALQTPNLDTPYLWAGPNLRTEPMLPERHLAATGDRPGEVSVLSGDIGDSAGIINTPVKTGRRVVLAVRTQ